MSHNKPLLFTKDGYRYFWCEDDEPLCKEYLRDMNTLEPNKRNNPSLVMYTKRMIIKNDVRLSESDRAPQLKLNDDTTAVTGDKGYSMIRATHGCNRGSYYFEAHIDSMPDNSATRIGWGQRFANLQAPLGYDHFGYSLRSRCGTKFHQAKGRTYDRGGGYGQGDTIGCMIELPYGNKENRTEARHLPISIKSHAFLVPAKKKDTQFRMAETKDEPSSLISLKELPGSKISFFKNGMPLGIAFDNLFEGHYFPSISLYKNCTVSVNFGPRFRFPPVAIKSENSSGDVFQAPYIDYSPAQDIVDVNIIDHLLADIIFIVDKEIPIKGENSLKEEMKTLMKPD